MKFFVVGVVYNFPHPFRSRSATGVRDELVELLLQLSPETTYSCSVAASNEFGLGEYSPVVQGTTLARTSKWPY